MPFKKIKDYNKLKGQCMDSEHNPPMHMVLEAGEYEYECPSCGKKTKLVVPLITM